MTDDDRTVTVAVDREGGNVTVTTIVDGDVIDESEVVPEERLEVEINASLVKE